MEGTGVSPEECRFLSISEGKNLKEYRSEKTNIIVCHRLTAVMHADLIIVMDDGKIVERGNHNELMALKGWYYEQFNNQKMTGGDNSEE